MLALDTNILFSAIEETSAPHAKAAAFVALRERDDVALSEFALLELYVLLRNPSVLVHPRSAAAATEMCLALRRHPRWQVLGFPVDSAAFHDELWPKLSTPDFARRRAYDWRMALSLIRQGVDELATVNTKDFQGFGFRRVWNPLAE